MLYIYLIHFYFTYFKHALYKYIFKYMLYTYLQPLWHIFYLFFIKFV